MDYKWVILVACILMNFVCLGFCSSNKGMYLTAITDALDIKRSVFSINDSCRYVASALVNLFFGTLVAKIGIRKMTAVGFISTAASMLTYALAENVWTFYLGGTLLGIFTALNYTGYALGAPLINLSYDVLGSYKYALLISGTLMLLCGIAFCFVFKEVEQTKKQALQEQCNG